MSSQQAQSKNINNPKVFRNGQPIDTEKSNESTRTANQPLRNIKGGIDNKDFTANAEPLEVRIGGQLVGYATVKEFQSGGVGYNLTGKTHIKVGNRVANLQLGLNLSVIDSKNQK